MKNRTELNRMGLRLVFLIGATIFIFHSCKKEDSEPCETSGVISSCQNGVHDSSETVTVDGVVYEMIDCDDDSLTACPPCTDFCSDSLLCDEDSLTQCPPCATFIPTCTDGILNQEEEFVDCGGPICPECPPSCDNGILDWVDGWQEYGVDCGGPCDDLGQYCCNNGVWDINPFDQTLSENWVDCVWEFYPYDDPFNPGGLISDDSNYPGSANENCPICPLCDNGRHDPSNNEFAQASNGSAIPVIDCTGIIDPMTGIFIGDCEPCASLCGDGMLNGAETGVDCGGPDCPPCGPN